LYVYFKRKDIGNVWKSALGGRWNIIFIFNGGFNRDKKIIIATHNKGKLDEFKKILKNFKTEVLSLNELGFFNEIPETGSTFEENSMIKARHVHEKFGEIVVADDSGLEIDALNGAPGIFSARFSGAGKTDEDRVEKVLHLLKGVLPKDRTARFICSITVIWGPQTFFQTRGACEGRIALSPIGENGFGYDPIFYLAHYDKTMAQLEPELKNQISHRGKAMDLMQEELKKMNGGHFFA
jgi:XTP/dITP diphosphohydrolase